MKIRFDLKTCLPWILRLVLLPLALHGFGAHAAAVADATESDNRDLVMQLLAQGADPNEAQPDGNRALHWAVMHDDETLVAGLLAAGADFNAMNRAEAGPMLLAALNGNARIISLLLQAGVDPNAVLTTSGDTALMISARTGIVEAVEVLLQAGAGVNNRENWGGSTALMWAASEGHADIVRVLLDQGADTGIRTAFIPRNTNRGLAFEGLPPEFRPAGSAPVVHASGEFTALHFAAREGHRDICELLLGAGADINARTADGKDALGLAIFNGSFGVASNLIAQGANVNQADAEGFTPLFWAVDRRNPETAPNFPWIITEDPLPLVRQLLEAGADPNALINRTPQALMREGSPRIVYATALMRAAFSGDITLVRLLLDYGADPFIRSSDDETALSAAAGTGFIFGFHKERPVEERLQVIQLLVELGLDVNWHDDYGITPLMVAANYGDTRLIQFLVDVGADLGAFDLGEKNDGVFGASIEPLMPIDYAIGVGTFRPNNAIVFNEAAVQLMEKLMAERGIEHATSECTLRGFTCSVVNMDPRTATPATIEKARQFQRGYQVDELKASGLEVSQPL
jgi:ankyrin repeat protein